MMSEKHPTGKHLPHPVKPVLLCSLIGAAAVALLLAGFSFLLTRRIFRIPRWNHWLCWQAVPGCLLAGFLCAKLHGRSGLLTGAACRMMVFGIIFLTGCLTMGGALGPSVWLKGLIFLFCGAIGRCFGAEHSPSGEIAIYTGMGFVV